MARRRFFLLGLACISTFVTAAPPPVDFNEAPRVGAGGSEVVAADFNGDGKLDFVTGGSIQLNRGDGIFDPPVQAFQGGYHVVTADFNRDGKPDLASVWEVALGNGDGTFRPTATNRVEEGTQTLAVGDLDRDGDLDLVTANLWTNRLGIFWNNGGGIFSGPTHVPVPEVPYRIAVGDLNRDGHPDVVTANWKTNSVSVLLGPPVKDNLIGFVHRTNLVVRPDHANAQTVALVDMNMDGLLDLVVGGFGIWLGNGDGTFRPGASLPENFPMDLEIDDINGDGMLDVVSLGGWGSVTIAFGNRDGTFSAAVYGATGFLFDGVAVGDFNGDGRRDLIAGDRLLVQKTDGTFTAPEYYGIDGYHERMAITDLNGDNLLDLAVASETNIIFRFGMGNGQFAASGRTEVASPASDLKTADMNADGQIDLIVALLPAKIQVLLGSGRGQFREAPSITLTNSRYIYRMVTGDFDNDEKIDVITVNASTNSVENSGTLLIADGRGSFTDVRLIDFHEHPHDLVAGDFNNDGKLDLATAQFERVSITRDRGTVGILLNTGNGAFGEPVFYEGWELDSYLRAVDLNHDGNLDIVSLDFHGHLTVFLGTGDGRLIKHARYGACCTGLEIGDFNNDMHPDVMVVDYRRLTLLLGKGDGAFQSPRYFRGAIGGHGPIKSGDFNRDGHLDLVASDARGILVLLNQSAIPLGIARAGDTARLNWPAFTNGFELESTTDPGSTNGWSRLPGTFVVENQDYVVTQGMDQTNRFYRLKRP